MINPDKRHLYDRAMFGLSPAVYKQADKTDFAWILAQASGNKPIKVLAPIKNKKEEMLTEETSKKTSQNLLKQEQLMLNAAWFKQFSIPTASLREKMTFFWHNHFACRSRAPYLAQLQNNTLRQYALGKFGDLLMAVSKDSLMMQFLNSNQNRKNSPNENFAREVMELFTLGQGNYTEDDIRNAARAFTGWSTNGVTGAFFLRPHFHDEGIKQFRGKTGNFNGEDIIAQLLEDRQTARFIAAKIWKHFVSEDALDEEVIRNLADRFYQSDYDISSLLTDIYAGKAFYDKKYQHNRIKSPIELLAGIEVQTGGTLPNPANILFLQKAFSQVLFQPPNVGGWPVGKQWIDSSSLTFRMSLPGILFRNTKNEFQGKDDGDANDITNQFKQASKITFSADWTSLSQQFTGSTSNATLQALEEFLLPVPTSGDNRKIVAAAFKNSTGEIEVMQKLFTGFMSLPEYQLS